MKKIITLSLLPILCGCSLNDGFVQVSKEIFQGKVDQIVRRYYSSYRAVLHYEGTFEYENGDKRVDSYDRVFDISVADLTWDRLEKNYLVVSAEIYGSYLYGGYLYNGPIEYREDNTTHYIGNGFKMIADYDRGFNEFPLSFHGEAIFDRYGYVLSSTVNTFNDSGNGNVISEYLEIQCTWYR